MLRALCTFTTGLFFTFLAALPASAQDAQTFQVQGVDARQGPYSGQVTLSRRADGQVDVVRTVQFADDGATQTQSGVLARRGKRLQGLIREAVGATGQLAQQASAADLLTIQVDAAEGTCRGTCVGAKGLSRFQGVSPRAAAAARRNAVAAQRNVDRLKALQAAQAADAQADAAALAQAAAALQAADVAAEQAGLPPVDGVLGEPAADELSPPPPLQTPSGEYFNGRAIYDYDPAFGITDPAGAYRVGGENVDFDGNGFTTQLDALLADPNLSQVESLVIGYWGYDGVDYATPLINAKDSLTGLAELFVGDIDQEEAEISWIENTDLGPLLASLPNLELLKVRGGNELGFSGAHRHEHLREIVIESGGTPASAIRELGAMELPALERLELWLGTDEYGCDAKIDDVRPLLQGDKLPSLKYLGLMNSDISDAIAAEAAYAPILPQLETLDLSMGTLSDAGGGALLYSDGIKQLQRLILDHHYMNDVMVRELEALGPVVVTAGDPQLDPNYPADRYVEVGE